MTLTSTPAVLVGANTAYNTATASIVKKTYTNPASGVYFSAWTTPYIKIFKPSTSTFYASIDVTLYPLQPLSNDVFPYAGTTPSNIYGQVQANNLGQTDTASTGSAGSIIAAQVGSSFYVEFIPNAPGNSIVFQFGYNGYVPFTPQIRWDGGNIPPSAVQNYLLVEIFTTDGVFFSGRVVSQN